MFEEELETASALALRAGEIVMQLYRGDVAVELKGKNDPVTKADRRANEYLVDALRARFPTDGVVAEETPDRSDITKSRCWFVDPLDGTKEFIAQNGEFSVMIGLAVEGRAMVGVVYQPVTSKLYRGVVGDSAELVIGEDVQPLRVSQRAVSDGLRLVVSRSHRSSSTDELVKRLGVVNEQRSGSVGLKVGLIAEENADLYIHLSDRSARWDACGPEAILHAAGGSFTDVSGEPFDYRLTDVFNRRGILACNQTAYAQVLPQVRELAQERGFLK